MFTEILAMNDQIFKDHDQWIAAAFIASVVMVALPRQPRAARTLAVLSLLFALAYPVAIVLLSWFQYSCGESYGYLIYGALLAITIGICLGVLFLAWSHVYLRSLLNPKAANVFTEVCVLVALSFIARRPAAVLCLRIARPLGPGLSCLAGLLILISTGMVLYRRLGSIYLRIALTYIALLLTLPVVRIIGIYLYWTFLGD